MLETAWTSRLVDDSDKDLKAYSASDIFKFHAPSKNKMSVPLGIGTHKPSQSPGEAQNLNVGDCSNLRIRSVLREEMCPENCYAHGTIICGSVYLNFASITSSPDKRDYRNLGIRQKATFR